MTTVVGQVADLPAFVGTDLGATGWVVIDQEAIDAFARVTIDEQWIHVDVQRAASGPFGATIAHGFLTLSLCSHFVGELLEVRGAGMAVNYGLDRVRFPAPVPAGSRVRARGRLLSAQERGDAVQVVTEITIEREGADKPVCVAEQVTRFYTA